MPGVRDSLAELAGTALLLLIGLSAVVLAFASSSPVVRWVPNEDLRRLLTGIVFAGGGTAIVYSPLGRRSGGHLNPAVTLAFLRLGKITPVGAAMYWAAQLAGGLIGAGVVWLIWMSLADQVGVGATVPGSGGAGVSVGAEAASTFLLVLLILSLVDRPSLHRFTPAAAGALVALLVFVEAPVSGTSLNPARSLGPAVVGGELRWLWVYVVGPTAGALIAATLFRWRRSSVRCAKLIHDDRYPCRFIDCRYTPAERRVVRPSMEPQRR